MNSVTFICSWFGYFSLHHFELLALWSSFSSNEWVILFWFYYCWTGLVVWLSLFVSGLQHFIEKLVAYLLNERTREQETKLTWDYLSESRYNETICCRRKIREIREKQTFKWGLFAYPPSWKLQRNLGKIFIERRIEANRNRHSSGSRRSRGIFSLYHRR